MTIEQSQALWSGRLIVAGGTVTPATPVTATRSLLTRRLALSAINGDGTRPRGVPPNPWDAAHALVAAGKATFAEPDCVQSRLAPAQVNARGAHLRLFSLDLAPKPEDAPHEPALWGPDAGADAHFSPAWYQDRGGFAAVHATGNKGDGSRIMHLDTGYAGNASDPRNLRPAQGWNYYGDDPAALVDSNHELFDRGHGAGTIGLLAGNTMTLDPQPKWGFGDAWTGDVGCAPDAEVVPVVIGGVGGTVVHLGDSSMTQGLRRALGGDPACPRVDVVTISHGGYPVQAWADAVNDLYEAGIVVVAAAGDWYGRLGVAEAPPHYTVYPAAFWRVITATGVTFHGTGYQADNMTEMQGSYGPDVVLKKSVAAFTPNVPWMQPTPAAPSGQPALPKQAAGWDMSGGGTSAATPQVAAACALWLAQYKDQFPQGWQRVEACRYALLKSATPLPAAVQPFTSAHGSLNVQAMLDPRWVQEAKDGMAAGQIVQRDPDRVSWALIRDLIGRASPGNPEMYEVEAAQTLYRSSSSELVHLAMQDWRDDSGLAAASGLSQGDRDAVRKLLLQHDISLALRQALSGGAVAAGT